MENFIKLKRYLLKRNEMELKEIEKDLAEYLGCPFVRCAYDCVNSHKYQDKEEMKYRKESVEDAYDTTILDYIINYEIYSTKESYETYNNGNGGDDGRVHELYYLKGNGNYIVIIGDKMKC